MTPPNDGNLRRRLTPELVRTLVVCIARDEHLARVAVRKISIDDFDESREGLEKAVVALVFDGLRTIGCLPTRESMLTEFDRRFMTEGAVREMFEQIRSGLLEFLHRVATEAVPSREYAMRLLHDFIWQRQGVNQIIEKAEQGYFGREEWEAAAVASRNACLVSAHIDPASWRMDARLADPVTFKAAEFVPTGYPKLDDQLGGGLSHGGMTTMGGPTGLGKTTTVTNLGINAAKAGVPTMIVSLEMPASDLIRLSLSILSGVPRRAIRTWRYAAAEQAEVDRAIESLAALPLLIVDRKSLAMDPGHPTAPDTETIEAAVRDVVRDYHVKLVIIDYLAKVAVQDDKIEEVKRMAVLNEWAFNMAQALDIHIVALAQQNKASLGNVDKRTMKRHAGLQDVRGVIESVADPDNVILLTRDDYNTDTPMDTATMNLVVIKARHGRGGVFPLLFKKETGRLLMPTDYLRGESIGGHGSGGASA